MKRAFKTAVCACLIGAMLVIPAYAETGTVTGSSVNLRTGPGMNYGVLECLDWGTKVNVTDRSSGGWYRVEYDGQTGFMSSDYLQIDEDDFSGQFTVQRTEPMTDIFQTSQTSQFSLQPAAAESSQLLASPQNNTANGYINAMYVRFRSGPGQGYAVLGEYNTGKAVTVNGSSGDWTQCTIDGRDGYVYSAYVTSGEFSRSTGGEVKDEFAVYSGRSFVQTAPTPTPSPEAVPAVTPTPAPTQTPAPEFNAIVSPAPKATDAPGELLIAPQSADETRRQDGEAGQQYAGYGHILGDYVRFRQGPGTNYPIIDSYNRGTELAFLEQNGDWVKCVIAGETGYIFSQYVEYELTGEKDETQGELPGDGNSDKYQADPEDQASAQLPETVTTEARDGYINGNNVRMRSRPSMQSDILGELFFGNAVTITGVSGDWTACTYGDWSGYVYSSYVKEGTYTYNTTSSTGSAQGQEIAQYALQFVGYNYTWGGMSPDTGFDCSGLVYYVYSQFGYTLNRVASDQARNGVAVNDLEPGDVLCFYTSGSYIGHAGIYVGDGKFVHAANSATGVVVSDLNGYYSSRGYEARRIVN